MNHLAPAALTETGTRPRRVLVVFNPAAGRNRRGRLERVLEAARAAGCALRLEETKAPGHAEEIARTASPEDFDLIAAAGGDGTINEIVNGLKGLKGKPLALGIIPLGTANVLADEIGLSRAAPAVAAALATGPLRPIRVGAANGRRFVMMAGAGFDANVVAAVSLDLKRKLGPLAYVWEAAHTAFMRTLPDCAVRIDGLAHVSASAVACNGRRYGGPFVAAPAASLSDDSFQVVLMRGRSWFAILRYGLGLMAGRVGAWPDVALIAGRDVTIEGVPGQPVQADGDIIAHLPVRIVMDPEPVWLAYPR